uniref:Uncharacterized protein n=1 Tax=Coccidioides posadasii RMSCC 3488 TaxID=454284 RepID=A0A0J6FBT2_COCPO|nr:hypothetical protein CPAG_02759 [Coccidioides posadasii RMSCC 3488]
MSATGWLQSWTTVVLYKVQRSDIDQIDFEGVHRFRNQPHINPWFFWTLLGFLQLLCN